MKNFYILVLLLFITPVVIAQTFYNGVDLSYVNELETCGTSYLDEASVETDPYTILADKGANIVRLRLWHNPQWTSFSNLEDVKKSISRAKADSMEVMLDIHYSDFWADPGRQWRPEAWNGISDDAILGDSVYQYTYNTLKALNNEGLLPEQVQIGNEINGNILIERTTQDIDDKSPGMYPINWTRQAALLNKGIEAVQQINTELSVDIKTIIHVAQPENAVSWFASATSNGLTDFDIIGLSYYPEWSDLDIWQTGEYIATFVEKYQKDVMIVEVGYPWTSRGNDNASNVLGNGSKFPTYGNVFSTEMQRDFLVELSYLIKENGGSGIVYWEPAWVSSTCKTYWATGSHYENAALFDFDNKLHIGAEYLSLDHTQIPDALAKHAVSFKVNMKGVDVKNGVYVTGDFTFTGDTWILESMILLDNDIYEFVDSVPGRTTGAYIYYNNNVWDDTYRETVPLSCAKIWDTHREYIIKDTDVSYEFAWSSCSAIPPTNINTVGSNELSIYPTKATNSISIKTEHDIQTIQLINFNGQIFPIEVSSAGIVNIESLTPGFYFIKIKTSTETSIFKFVKL